MKTFLYCLFLLVYINGKSQEVGNQKPISKLDTVVSQEEGDELRPNREIEKAMPVYKVDSSMFGILKRIIKLELGCPNYKKGISCFYMSIRKHCDYYNIYIFSAYLNDICSFSDWFGIFEFEDIKFICRGDYITELFHMSKLSPITIKYNGKDSMNDGTEFFSEWGFEYRNEKFLLKSNRTCPGHK